jgi:hypothetical protein
MPLKPLFPAILLALVMSAFIGVLAAGRGSGAAMALACALFVAQVCFSIMRVNAPFWQLGPGALEEDLAVACVWNNAVLAALIYAWGATAMFAIYSLSGLTWRHWWQYGAGMSLFAAGILIYAQLLSTGRTTLHARALHILMGVTALQGIATATSFVYLVTSGKLYSLRDDWASSYIFLAGSLILMILSIVATLSYRNIGRAKVTASGG